MKNLITSLVVIFIVIFTVTLAEKFVINLTISENKGGGEDVINLRTYIMQKKLTIKSSASFEIVSNDPEIVNYFLLDSKTGQIKLRSHIDREAICKHTDYCRMTILIAVDGKVLELVIDVLDVNDNIPQFPMRFKTLFIQENSDIGLELSLPTAEDADSAEYGISKYYLEDLRTTTTGRMARYRGTQYFRILEKTINNIKIPYLKTIKEIDREEVDQFELILVSEDSGKQRGSCTITINIADVNDNSPQWPSNSIHRKVRECGGKGPLLELQAFDRDDSSTINGQVKYKISDHSPKMEIINRIFYIAGSNLFLSTQSLQTTEIGNKISFFITAIDGGGRENDTSVTIEIEDCNDHAPAIQLSRPSTTIMENDKRLRLLTTVTVKDDDRDANSDFNCELNDTSFLALTKQDSFHQPNGGMLVMYQLEKIVDAVFDREKLEYYSTLIRCIDQGRPPLTGEKTFTISILDENDNAPKFPNKESQLSITENNVIGALIGYVKAVDLDSIDNGRITYQILNNDDNVYFTITNYGKIEAKWKFDRETKSSYTLAVLARDNGNPALNDTCQIKITVLDVNDCLPIFKQQYFYQITESNGPTTIHAIIGKVAAEDQDAGENGTVYYEIQQSTTNYRKYTSHSKPLLKISSDGTLSIYGVVDREKTSSIQAEVVALDNGRQQLSSVTTVIVDVLDLNDNKPRFKQPMTKVNYINVSADAAVGTILTSVEAEDPDKGENGTIIYSIIGQKNMPDNSPFQLQQDGRLILIQSIKERDSGSRLPDRLLIKASDSGEPPLIELLTLHIKYILNDQRARENLWPNGDRKPIDRNRINGGVLDGYRENEGADNMILLYVLAGVLFSVFLIVLLVLMYTYFSGRFIRSRHSDHSHEKQLNNYCNEGPGSYECELLRTGSPTDGREDFNKVSTISMTFPTVETPDWHQRLESILESIRKKHPVASSCDYQLLKTEGNYTHLMMNDAKYTPIQIPSKYFQTMCSTSPISSPQDAPQCIHPVHYELCNENRVMTRGADSNRLSNKWNSNDNISQTSDAILGTNNKGQEHSGLHNAHSYAAYINQFGKDDHDTTAGAGENCANTTKLNQQTLPHPVAKLSKENKNVTTYQPVTCPKSQSKRCYVASSFV